MTILAVIAAIGLAMPAVNRGVPASRTGTGASRYPVTARVTVVPPPDSTLDTAVTRPGITRGDASFLIGPVRYTVAVSPYSGTVHGAAYEARGRIISSPGYQVTPRECYFVTTSGLLGRWGRFSAWGWSGVYAVLVVDGTRIEATASGTNVRLNLERDGIERSMRSLAYASR